MKYDYNILEEKIKSLPQDMQVAMFSPKISDHVQEIAQKYSLDIEQTGVLMDITGYVMLALIPSRNFVSELSKEAGIDATKANAIAKDINDNVFAEIRDSLRKIQEIAENTSADLEKAGNFSVEKNQSDENTSAHPSTENISKADLLNSIENPETNSNLPINMVIPVPTIPNAAPASQVSTPKASTQPSPLVDRLMSTPVATPNEKTEKKMPSSQPIPASRPGPDPYREPIE